MIKPFNRRYIGNKNKLNHEIRNLLKKTNSDSFLDLFAGTASVTYNNLDLFKKIGVNDFLNHNFSIYKAFFSTKIYSKNKIEEYISIFNNLKFKKNIFSDYYGGKFFTKSDASKIWEARKIIEREKQDLNEREYYILISILIFAADKASRSVGHFESYLRSGEFKKIEFKNLDLNFYKNNFKLFNKDANELVKKTRDKFDVVYIDPPYNSRQYAYFYHVLETISLFSLTKKNDVVGIVKKPDYIYDKSSEYSKTGAFDAFKELIKNLKCKFIIVSYNNTYSPKSTSSMNKISLEQIKEILSSKGTLKIKKNKYKHFNAGKTNFNNHIEYLFFVEVKND